MITFNLQRFAEVFVGFTLNCMCYQVTWNIGVATCICLVFKSIREIDRDSEKKAQKTSPKQSELLPSNMNTRLNLEPETWRSVQMIFLFKWVDVKVPAFSCPGCMSLQDEKNMSWTEKTTELNTGCPKIINHIVFLKKIIILVVISDQLFQGTMILMICLTCEKKSTISCPV